MIKVTLTYTPPDTDKWFFPFPCPKCCLETEITLGQIRREEYFICRGCHINIRAIDHLGGVDTLTKKIRHLFR